MTREAHFSFPTVVEARAGCVRELGKVLSSLGVGRPLLVTDPGFAGTPGFAAVREAAGAEAVVFSQVRGNPEESDVLAAVEAFAGCDSVVGVGGGSALDVAKVLRVPAAVPGVRLENFYELETMPRLAPFVAIPTTAGTGSEVGRSSVIVVGGVKRVFFHPALLAERVLLDPELTASLPPFLTAATGMDALTHCVEAFTSPVFHPLCDGIALEGARLAFEWLPRAVENGADLEARLMMQIAAAMGAVAFQKDLGAAHSMSHALSARFGLHHGLANALCLPAVMEWNAARKPGLYRRVARAWELPSDEDQAAVEALRGLLSRIGIEPGLGRHGVGREALPALAQAAIGDSCHKTNPVPVGVEDFLALFEACL